MVTRSPWGAFLREQRLAARVSGAELARRMGCSRQWVHELECPPSDRTLTESNLRAYLAALGLEPVLSARKTRNKP